MLSAISTLQHLHLGNFELSEEALIRFWTDSIKDVKEITLQDMELSRGNLSSLTAYTSLKPLAISDCKQVRAIYLLTNVQDLAGDLVKSLRVCVIRFLLALLSGN